MLPQMHDQINCNKRVLPALFHLRCPSQSHERSARGRTRLTTSYIYQLSLVVATATVSFDKSPNAFHISSNESYGFGPVAIEPGHKVGINDRNCSFTAILATSKTTSTQEPECARSPWLPTLARETAG